MKRMILLTICIFSQFLLHAGDIRKNKEKKFTYGVEWGYVASIHCGIHHNFFSEEGYRVDLTNKNFRFTGNGDVYLNFGYNLSDEWNISLYAGIAGIYDFHKAVPISIRATKSFELKDSKDKWLMFIDAGSGLSLKSAPQYILTGKLGCGYRIILSPDSSIDITGAYRITLTHPDIIHDGYEIKPEWINRNNAYISALAISLALNF